jgi:hypothetical protein
MGMAVVQHCEHLMREDDFIDFVLGYALVIVLALLWYFL